MTTARKAQAAVCLIGAADLARPATSKAEATDKAARNSDRPQHTPPPRSEPEEGGTWGWMRGHLGGTLTFGPGSLEGGDFWKFSWQPGTPSLAKEGIGKYGSEGQNFGK